METVDEVPENVQDLLSRMGYQDPNEARNMVLEAWSPLLDKMPSKHDDVFNKVRLGYSARQAYIKEFGFMLLTTEVLDEMTVKLQNLDIKRFIELGAGTGFLSKALIDRGFKGQGYSLEIPEDETKNHWGLARTEMYNFCVDTGILELGDMRDLNNLDVPELVISSWVPYEGGQEVLDFFDQNGLPNYYIVVGEGYGGCTGSDSFHDWLGNNYKAIDDIRSYESFDMIHDDIKIYQKKGV